MKKYFLLSAIIISMMVSCNQKFKVGAPYQEVTAIYGLLSTNDTAQYIKVMKGYYDETNDNLKIAQTPDSIYFKNLEVSLEVLNNGNITKTVYLNLVDLNLEGYTKDTGNFAAAPNYGYKSKEVLDATKRYRLRVKNLDSGKEVYAETDLINSSVIVFTKPYINTQPLNFSLPLDNTTFAWNAPASATFFEVSLRFWYQEINNNTLVTQYKYVDLPLIQDISSSGDGNTQAIMSNEQFYRALVSELGAAPNYISRRVDTPDLILSAGGNILKTYIDATNAQGGITADQIKPNYTNFIGEHVLGIFSTRGTRFLYAVPFTQKTVDSIVNSSRTKALNIVGVSTE